MNELIPDVLDTGALLFHSKFHPLVISPEPSVEEARHQSGVFREFPDPLSDAGHGSGVSISES